MTCVIPHPHFGPCDHRPVDVRTVVAHVPITDELLADAAAVRQALDHLLRRNP